VGKAGKIGEVRDRMLGYDKEIRGLFPQLFDSGQRMIYAPETPASPSVNQRLNDIVHEAIGAVSSLMDEYGPAQYRIERLARRVAGKETVGWALQKLHRISLEHRSWNPEKPYFVLTPLRTVLNSLRFYPDPEIVKSYFQVEGDLRRMKGLTRRMNAEKMEQLQTVLSSLREPLAAIGANVKLPQITPDRPSVVVNAVRPTIRELNSELSRIGREMGLEDMNFPFRLW